MTIKLYEENPYLKECKSIITNIIKENDDILIVLDKTIFFPEGGGQGCDTGYIGNSKILYVFEKDNIIYHKVDVLPSDKEVICTLNWNRRLDHMQQHCGEHIVSGIIKSMYNGNNKGFHMGDEYVTLDIDIKDFTEEMLYKVEIEANKAIYENREIKISLAPNKEAAEKFPVRKNITLDKDIRIVEIVDTDCVACCGTHPSRTGDIGIIKLLKAEKNKGMSRIYLKCGMRALLDFQTKNNVLTNLNQKFSAEINTLVSKIDISLNKLDESMKQSNELRISLCSIEVKNLINNNPSKLITKIYTDKTFDEIQIISKKILKDNSTIILLCSLKDNKILLTHNTTDAIDCGKLFKENIKEFNGRGGGSKLTAQGVFTNSDDTSKFHEILREIINKDN